MKTPHQKSAQERFFHTKTNPARTKDMITQAISAGICLAPSLAFFPIPFPPQTPAAFALPKLGPMCYRNEGPDAPEGATIAHNS